MYIKRKKGGSLTFSIVKLWEETLYLGPWGLFGSLGASLFIVNTEYSHLNTINYQFFEDTSRDLLKQKYLNGAISIRGICCCTPSL